MKLGFFFLIFVKYSNIKSHENLSSGNQGVPCRQTDKLKLNVAFHNFAHELNMLLDSGPIYYEKGFCCRDWLVKKWDLNLLSLLF
jgi:hypothetical protein